MALESFSCGALFSMPTLALDVLVNNVSGFWAHRHPTVDGPMALSPRGRADWREADCVKHQADAPYAVKHLLGPRRQVSAGLSHMDERDQTVSVMYALDCHNLLL
jgi:hypothetical protein